MRKLRAFLLISLVGRAEQLPVKRYTTADGLAGNRVESIFSDSRGFLWFGTTEGPCRFDPAKRGSGSPFQLFRLNSRVATSLVEDHSGAIWCGTFSGLFRLPRGGKAFEPVDIGMPLAAGGDGAIVSALLEDSQKTLWAGAGGALYRRTADGQLSRYTVRDGLPADFGFVQDLMEDREGQIWIATRKGVCRTGPRPRPGRPPIAQLYDTRSGLPGLAWTNSLFQASDGKIWAGAGATLNLFTGRPGSEAFRSYTPAHGLVEGTVEVMVEDRVGNLWIGTDGNGVMKIVRHGFVGFDERDGVTNFLNSIFESRRGELCVVVEEGKTSHRIFEWFDGHRFIPIRPAFPRSLTNFGWGASQVALQDQAGDWWFATGQGVCRFPRTASVTGLANLAPKAIYTERNGLVGHDVFRLFEDSRGDIWIATHTGVTRWERSTNKLHAVPSVPATPTAFAEDRLGGIWVGTYDGRLGRIRQGQWSAVEGFGPSHNGQVSSIHPDRAGRLWVGTDGPGLFRIDDTQQPQPALVQYTVNGVVAGLRIGAITEDGRGRIWVATARGVDCLDVSGGSQPRVRHYSAADGLAEGEGRLAFCDRSGALWFAMQHGLSRLVPEALELQAPPVFVTGVRVAGAVHPISDTGETDLRLPDLGPGQNHLEIDFSGFQFAPGEALLYQYGMEGDVPEWGPPVAGRTVNYAGLRPRHYRFHVRAVSSAGVASPQPAVVSFVILPHFWQRWWFLLLVAGASASLVYAAYRYRLGQMLKLERVRMRIATDLHDDIGASLSHIAVLSEVAGSEVSRLELGSDGQRLHAPLARIGSVSRELIDSMSDIVWATSPRKDRLSNLAQRMREFAGEVLGNRGIEFLLHADGIDQEMKLDPDVRREVFLIFKESVNNIVRHAMATRVTCRLAMERGKLALLVSDNGRGFSADADGRPPVIHGGGHGLASMRRRAESLGGTIEIATQNGQGVTIVARVPSPK